MTQDHRIFNRKLVTLRRNRYAAKADDYDFLLREMAVRLGDRLGCFRNDFPAVLNLGARHGILKGYLPDKVGQTLFVQAELSETVVAGIPGLRVAADEEMLPFAPASFDLVVSCGALHWVNDVPGTLVQIARCLKPGGLLVCLFAGGQTLTELRAALAHAELALRGGISPRVSPFIDVKDAGSLLQRAGFREPVTDSEILTVRYDDPLKLLRDIRGMGEANALIAATKHMAPRALFANAMAYYGEHFRGQDGRVPATFEFITLTGWKSDAAR